MMQRNILRGGLFVLACALVFLALRGANTTVIKDSLRQAEFLWFGPLLIVILASHLVRAWRWQMMLCTLKEGQAPSLRTLFYALMMGYMVNYALPRVGEVIRTAHVATRERLPFGGVLGTVVIERVIDMATLLVILGVSFLLLMDQTTALEAHFLTPLMDTIRTLPVTKLLLFLLGTLGLAALVYGLGRRWLQPVWTSFKDGLAAAHRSPHRCMLLTTTALMWLLYTLMAYIPLVMLNMTSMYALSLLDGMVIMVMGAIGVAAPLPGGIGSFHYITRITLVGLFGVDISLAVLYAVLVHGGQLLLYVSAGFFVMVLEGQSLGQLFAKTQEKQNSVP